MSLVDVVAVGERMPIENTTVVDAVSRPADPPSTVVVQKYGGSSVATPERINAVAERLVACRRDTPRLVVAVSAMGKTTDQLVDMARQVCPNPSGREYDLLLASGEQIAVSMLGLALQGRGVPAISFTASQCGIRTDGPFNRARIRSIDTARLEAELDAGKIVIVTGFQGITDQHEVTTLGRGGGDITGAALAAALGASVCEICTDVDGVYSADPSVVPSARLLPEISFEEAIELAASGAKVLHPRAAEICLKFKIPIHVRSSFHMRPGTWIRGGAITMEEAGVVGVTTDRKIAKVTLLDVPDRPGIAATLFQHLAEAEINIRLIIQGASSHDRARITFVMDEEFLDIVPPLFERWTRDGMAREIQVDRDMAKISIIGSRIAATPGLASRMFTALANEGINIDCISSTEMKIGCVIAARHLDRALRAVHREFVDARAEAAPGT